MCQFAHLHTQIFAYILILILLVPILMGCHPSKGHLETNLQYQYFETPQDIYLWLILSQGAAGRISIVDNPHIVTVN